MDYDNPSENELEQIRRVLMSPLSFPPFTDPNFRPERAKLDFLIRENERLIARLRDVLDEYKEITERLSAVQKALDNQKSYMQALRSFSRTTDSFMDDPIVTVKLLLQGREALTKRRHEMML